MRQPITNYKELMISIDGVSIDPAIEDCRNDIDIMTKPRLVHIKKIRNLKDKKVVISSLYHALSFSWRESKLKSLYFPMVMNAFDSYSMTGDWDVAGSFHSLCEGGWDYKDSSREVFFISICRSSENLGPIKYWFGDSKQPIFPHCKFNAKNFLIRVSRKNQGKKLYLSTRVGQISFDNLKPRNYFVHI